jgi:hypothetical protein
MGMGTGSNRERERDRGEAVTLPQHTSPGDGAQQSDRDAVALAGSLTTVGYAMFALLQAGPLPEAPVQVQSVPSLAAGPAVSYTQADGGPAHAADDTVDDDEGESAFATTSDPLPAAPAAVPPGPKISAREMQDLLSELSSLDDQ